MYCVEFRQVLCFQSVLATWQITKLAQKYLSVYVTSVPSERIFSKSVCINDNFRSCMNLENPFFIL